MEHIIVSRKLWIISDLKKKQKTSNLYILSYFQIQKHQMQLHLQK